MYDAAGSITYSAAESITYGAVKSITCSTAESITYDAAESITYGAVKKYHIQHCRLSMLHRTSRIIQQRTILNGSEEIFT